VVRALLMGDVAGFSKLRDHQLRAFASLVLGTFAEALDDCGPDLEFANTWGDALYAVFASAPVAARCALEIQERLGRLDLAAAGLPETTALRLSGHVGPVFPVVDPVLKRRAFMGAHVSRTARIEPVTPPGAVYVTEAFAAALELAGTEDLRCDYVGHLPTAKDYGRLRMYRLRRPTGGPTPR
jgi:class 3 adenylate cyclase